jgi:hypothetical protein
LNIQGQEVLTASARIAPLGWTAFVEPPVKCLRPLYLRRSAWRSPAAAASISQLAESSWRGAW